VMRAILGWDVGGANIKAARLAEDGGEPLMWERALPLWREPQRLPAVLSEAARSLGMTEMMGVTMTAELADCFATKREGVAAVLDAFKTAFPAIEPWVYCTDGMFRPAAVARQRPLRVAAANWMASATVVSRLFPDALFIDVGSTTTDIIPILGGRVVARGKTDPARLRSGELIYTGALRTPICAVVRSVRVRGRRCRVAAEYFAIVADAHLWRGAIESAGYTCDTPDGRGRSRLEAGARLARMICADLEMLGDQGITDIANHVACSQLEQISSGIRQVMRRLGSRCPQVAVVAGQGAFIARAAANQAGLAAQDLADALGVAAARAVPAAAVAYLLAEHDASVSAL
jgi:(4-(4-[2-(gamma-L-glutamylamino)ethyl]phenoxymethyl)furan-2-yl)methanamine synthase